MSIEYIRSTYGVPAKVGGRVRLTGGREVREGIITGTSGPHLMIRVDGQKNALPYHPTWEIEYLTKE